MLLVVMWSFLLALNIHSATRIYLASRQRPHLIGENKVLIFALGVSIFLSLWFLAHNVLETFLPEYKFY